MIHLHFLILGARSFYVIDTDKKQLIEVEANSKDDLEKYWTIFFLFPFLSILLFYLDG